MLGTREAGRDELLINSLKTAFVWERRHSSVGSERLICNQQVVGSNPTAGSLSDCGLRTADFGLGAAAVSPTEKPMTRKMRLLFQATRGSFHPLQA
jgi:hypothetical protein